MSYVYMIQQGSDGPIKIGRARNLSTRFVDLQVASAERLHLRAVFPGGRALEQQIQNELQAHRLRGEWFAPSDEVRVWFLGTLPLDNLVGDPSNKGGRPTKDRMPECEAIAIWQSPEFETPDDAVMKMPGWTVRTAFRLLGGRGLRVGRPVKKTK
jgi:hypothetical protein